MEPDRILVIDDEPDMQGVFETIFSLNSAKELFKRYGGLFGDPDASDDISREPQKKYLLYYADSGQKGIDMAEDCLSEGESFSLAFIDIQMHEVSGTETAVKLHELDPDIEIVLITGGSYSPDQVTQMTYGRYFYFLNKPFTANEILMFARTLCHQRRDRIEKAQLTRDLSHSEARFRLIAESARDAVIKVDDHGDIVYRNRAAELLTGYPADEVHQKNIAGIIIPEDKRSLHREALAKFQETGRGKCIGQIIEGSVLTKDKTNVPVEVSLASVRFDNQWYAVGIVRDISKRKQFELDLKEGQDEAVILALEAGRSQCSAMALHTIGNAVTPILIYLDKLQKLDFKKISQYLERCRRELTGLQDAEKSAVDKSSMTRQVETFMGELLKELDTRISLSDDITKRLKGQADNIVQTLTFQQIYSPKWNDSKEPVKLNTLLTDLLKMRRSSFSKREITIERDFTADLPDILVEKNRFMQVIANLIQNSISAIDQNRNLQTPVIRLRTTSTDNFVTLEITDNGCGITPERMKTIFSIQTPGKKSSGFGLHYCRHFLESNNGILHIESHGEGLGARVILPLPALAVK